MMTIPDSSRRARRPFRLAAALPVLLLIMAAVGRANAQDADRRAASEQAFRSIATVLMNPRCLNCHTRVDYPKQGDDRHRHLFRVARGPDDRGLTAMTCSTCHQPTNNAASGVPGAPNWHLAPLRMAWEDLSVGQLCRTLKDASKNGARSLPALVEHLTGDPLVQWGWSPGDNRLPPPIGQSEFHDLVREWAGSGAACPR